MNKFGVVLGIAAVATLAGCKDPDFKRSDRTHVQDEVKSVETEPAATAAAKTPATVAIEPVAAPKCTCAPGTKHAEPCKCGAPDCKCIVETKPVITADLSKKPAEPEYTVYVVQNGDYLAKISQKYNVTISSIKRLNPSIKKDVILVGQKLKLPGKLNVAQPSVVSAAAGGAAAAAVAVPKKPSVKKGFAPYVGATKEYVVKNGDTLGSIAYGNGINIRQLKELNSLSSDSLKIGQKLKIPAEKVAAAKKPAPVKDETKVVAAAAKKVADAAPAPADAVETLPADEVKEAEPAADEKTEAPAADEKAADGQAAAPAPDKSAEKVTTATYVVQEGDDMTGVSIRWGVSAAEIRELNNLADGDQLVPGQIIKLPADAQQ